MNHAGSESEEPLTHANREEGTDVHHHRGPQFGETLAYREGGRGAEVVSCCALNAEPD